MQLYRTSIVSAAIAVPEAPPFCKSVQIHRGAESAGRSGHRFCLELRIECRVVIWIIVAFLLSAGCYSGSGGGSRTASAPVPAARFSTMSRWDDGLAELCYYDAVDEIYGKPRQYTRVMVVNREWMNPSQMVKAESPAGSGGAGLPVFKSNIIEEIPTENYNYRYMVTLFLGRPGLRLEKAAASSQEWCGTTFKRAVRREAGVELAAFSYFEGEADQEWLLPSDADIYPHEAIFLLAREAGSSGVPMPLRLMPPLRSTHAKDPSLTRCTLAVEDAPHRVRTSMGILDARTVRLTEGTTTYHKTVSKPALLVTP